VRVTDSCILLLLLFAIFSVDDDAIVDGWQQILSQMESVAEKKAPRQPRFVQPLQNAEITEGQRSVDGVC